MSQIFFYGTVSQDFTRQKLHKFTSNLVEHYRKDNGKELRTKYRTENSKVQNRIQKCTEESTEHSS